MAKITYDSNYIRPIEAVSISDNHTHNENGERISTSYAINLRGKILVNRGSPTSSGTFGYYGGGDCEVILETGIGHATWIQSLMAKRCALSNLFDDDYRELFIGSIEGGSNLTCYPKILNFAVEESDNPQYWPFTVSMEADNIFCNGTPIQSTGTGRLRGYSETWEFGFDDSNIISESGDDRIHNVTHTVSANGLKTVGISGVIVSTAIDAARNYVNSRIGPSAVVPTLAISGFGPHSSKYNYVDTHSIDVTVGSYSVTENWMYATGSYVEQYTIEQTTTNSRSCPTVSINGSITGFGVRSLTTGEITTSKFANAKSYWDSIGTSGLHSRAQSRSGLTLYSNPVSSSISLAPQVGTVNYNYEFNGGPTRALTGSLWENITLSTNFAEDLYASITILGKGTLLQKINSSGFYNAYKTTLNVDAIYPCGSGHVLGPRYTPAYSGSIQTVLNTYNPLLVISGVGVCVVDSQSENWSVYDGLYNYSVTWAYQMSSICS